MRRLLVRDVNLLSTIAVVLMMGVLAGFGWQRSIATQRLREATQLLTEEAGLFDAVSQSLRETERTQLLYLASGSRPDMLAYRGAVRRTDVLADRLERHAAEDPGFGDMLLGEMNLVDTRQDVLAQEVALRNAGTPPATVMDLRAGHDLPNGSAVLDQLAAAGQTLDRKRRASLDIETRGLQSVRWLAAAVAVLGLVAVLSLFHLLGGAWRKLLRAETEQRKMALQLRGSLDSLSQGIAVFSDDGHLLNWNMRLRQMLDLPAALLRSGMSYAALEQHLAAGGAPFLEPLHAIRADAPGYDEIHPVVYEGRVRPRTATRGRPERPATTEARIGARTEAETQIEIRRTLMPQGGFVLTLTDMTERVQAERMLNEAQKMQALGQLTGGIAHDFNNMLTVIQGSLDIATVDSAASLADPVALLIARMRRAAHAAESGVALTRRLLTFARKQPLSQAPVDLGIILPELVPLLSHTIGESITISFSAEPSLWQAVADAGQLESAVLNLALNARDAMQGGGKLTIEASNISFDPRKAAPHPELTLGDYVRISVADTGHGMSRDVMARAFEPFFTTKSEERGTGLGLAMVFGFARQSGGQALIQSEPGQGTRITLYLPRAPKAMAAAAISEEASAAPAISSPEAAAPRILPSAASPHMVTAAAPHILPAAASALTLAATAPHILLVEDDASVREVASEMLRELGYRVSEAADGEAALHRLGIQSGPLDLLLTDLMLPGSLDGRALAARVRQIQPAVRILYMSGHPDGAQVLDAAPDIASQWLGKPFRRAQLASKVSGMLGLRTAEQAA